MTSAAVTDIASSQAEKKPDTTPPASGISVRKIQHTPDDVAKGPRRAFAKNQVSEIERASLSQPELTSYLSRLQAQGDAVEVFVTRGPEGSDKEPVRVAELHRLLLEKRIWGASVYHLVDGVAVVDVLTVRQSATTRVRSRR